MGDDFKPMPLLDEKFDKLNSLHSLHGAVFVAHRCAQALTILRLLEEQGDAAREPKRGRVFRASQRQETIENLARKLLLKLEEAKVQELPSLKERNDVIHLIIDAIENDEVWHLRTLVYNLFGAFENAKSLNDLLNRDVGEAVLEDRDRRRAFLLNPPDTVVDRVARNIHFRGEDKGQPAWDALSESDRATAREHARNAIAVVVDYN